MAEPVYELSLIIRNLSDIIADPSVPRNVKSQIQCIIHDLNNDSDPSVKCNKALNDLDGIAGDNNLQPYIRTEVWNVISLLEKF